MKFYISAVKIDDSESGYNSDKINEFLQKILDEEKVERKLHDFKYHKNPSDYITGRNYEYMIIDDYTIIAYTDIIFDLVLNDNLAVYFPNGSSIILEQPELK